MSNSVVVDPDTHGYEELHVSSDFKVMQCHERGAPVVVEGATKSRTKKTPACSHNAKWVVIVILALVVAALLGIVIYRFLGREPVATCISTTSSRTTASSEKESSTPSTTVPVATDCQALYEAGYTTSGVYTISPDGERRMNVYCEQDIDGGGWTVFQRRQNGEVNFFRNWTAYKHGFGAPGSEFWLGNDNIHMLTSGRGRKLKVEMVHPQGRLAYADYSMFYIENEAGKYRLHVTGYLSDASPGDAMKRQIGQAFSTYDVDNDVYVRDSWNCALSYKGGWWYEGCHHSNLNGLYGSTAEGEGINWLPFTTDRISLTLVKMMVKP